MQYVTSKSSLRNMQACCSKPAAAFGMAGASSYLAIWARSSTVFHHLHRTVEQIDQQHASIFDFGCLHHLCPRTNAMLDTHRGCFMGMGLVVCGIHSIFHQCYAFELGLGEEAEL